MLLRIPNVHAEDRRHMALDPFHWTKKVGDDLTKRQRDIGCATAKE